MIIVINHNSDFELEYETKSFKECNAKKSSYYYTKRIQSGLWKR